MRKISDQIQVFVGRKQTDIGSETFVAMSDMILATPDKRVKAPSTLTKLIQELLNRDVKFFVNGSGINLVINGHNILNIIDIFDNQFILLIKTCHVLKLPRIDFDIRGNPLKAKTSNRTKVIVYSEQSYKDFVKRIADWIFKLPKQYKR